MSRRNESDKSSDSLGHVNMGPSVFEGELCDVEERVTENISKIVTRFLLAAALMLPYLPSQAKRTYLN